MELHNESYSPDDLGWIIETTFDENDLIMQRGGRAFLNASCSFDIEVSSFYEGEEKRAIMYIWMLGINGYCITGRTWDEFMSTYNNLVKILGLTENIILPIYVHNLAYEFQFIKDRFTWSHVFAIDVRKPNYVRTTEGVEFRCSYQLSGYSLAKLGEQLRKYKVEKMVGDLDYSKVRHSKTILTDKEMQYCINDVLVVMAYIQEQIELEGDITKIPHTKTGYVRRAVKDNCLGNTRKNRRKNWAYRQMIASLTLEPEEYTQLHRAFQGGFTHASAIYSGVVLEDVDSYDFTSSYPAVMLSEKFPMSKAKKVTITDKEQLNYYLDRYCCLFDATFINIKPKQLYEDYIPVSRAWNLINQTVNNGRLVSADRVSITLTEQDFMIISKLYEWDSMAADNFKYYKKGYLPKQFVETILDFYEAKTTLKDVEGKEVEYMQGKSNVNCLYGMIVTNIVRDEIDYDGDWLTEMPNLEEAIDKYNKSRSRFLFYPWGVWVTAYARKNLFTGICSCNTDYVYSDTDSLKIIHGERHKEYIEQYNEVITNMIQKAMQYQNIPIERTRPKTIKGVEKPIGVWDYEGHYNLFKTLGAKRYLWKDDKGRTQMTVAGLSKKNGLEYMIAHSDKSDKKLFAMFNDNLTIPAHATGKNTHTYIDEEHEGIVYDYLGVPARYHEMSAVHMEPAEYSMSIGTEYAQYLLGIRQRRE